MTARTRESVVAVIVLLAALATPVIAWLLREPPYLHVDCGPPGPPAVRAAWLEGVGTASFVTAVVCAAIGLWADARARGRPAPDPLIVLAAALVLAAGAWWWADGTDSPIALWALGGYIGLLPAFFFVPMLLVRAARAVQRADAAAAWRAARGLAGWGVVVLVSRVRGHRRRVGRGRVLLTAA